MCIHNYLIAVWLIGLAGRTASGMPDTSLKWTVSIENTSSQLKSSEKVLYVEASIADIISLTDLKNEKFIDLPSQLVEVYSESLCNTITNVLNRLTSSPVYVFPGYKSQAVIVHKCPEKLKTRIFEINPSVFYELSIEEKIAIWVEISQEENDEKTRIDIGSLCKKNHYFDSSTITCIKPHRKLVTQSEYEEYKYEYGVENAIAILGLEELSLDLIQMMFNDLVEEVSNVDIYSDIFEITVSDISLLMDSSHFLYLDSETIDSMFGYLWQNPWDLYEVPLEESLEYLLTQSSLYINYYNFSDSSCEKSYEMLDNFFAYYSYNALILENDLEVYSIDSYDPEIAVYKKKFLSDTSSDLAFNLLDTTFSVSDNSLFTSEYIWSLFFLSIRSSELPSPHFGLSIYTSGIYESESDNLFGSEEVKVLSWGNRFIATVEIPNIFSSGFSIYCKPDPCFVPVYDSESPNAIIYIGTTGYFQVHDFECPNTSDLENEYIIYRDMVGYEEAISIYSLVEESDECFLTQIWIDLKTILSDGNGNSDCFEFFNGNLLNLMDSNLHKNLAEDLVNDIFGYSWISYYYIPSFIPVSLLNTVLDQTAMYIDYFNYSVIAYEKADLVVNRFYVLYADSNLYYGFDPLTAVTTEGLQVSQVSVYKIVILGSEVSGYTFSISSATVTIVSTDLFNDSDMVVLSFILFQSSDLISDFFSLRVFFAGEYDENDSDLQVDKEIEVSFSESLNAKITVGYKNYDNILCMFSGCTIDQVANNQLSVSITEEGLQLFLLECDSNFIWYQDYQACGFTCNDRCELCDFNNQGQCLSCKSDYVLSSDKDCVYCNVDNCDVCYDDNLCLNCIEPYQFSNSSVCVLCDNLNCDICYKDNLCLNCIEGYFFSNSSECVLCEDPKCLVCYSNNMCLECFNGYEFSTSLSCVECSDPNCNVCSEDNACFECDSGYELSTTSVCVSCSDPNCFKCSDNNYCSVCDTGYELSTELVCVKCSDPHCFKCSQENICSECDTNYELSIDFTCVICSDPNCFICSANEICSQCVSGYELSTNNVCVTCSNKNCEICSDNEKCYQCSSNYVLSSIFTCVSCNIQNCKTCSSDNICHECLNSEYFLYNNLCKTCQAPCKTCLNNYETCNSCGLLAEINTNKCSCITNAEFVSGSLLDCQCKQNYLLNDKGACQFCNKYISVSNITSISYSDDFTNIHIDFNLPVVEIKNLKCSDIIINVSKLGTNPNCSFVNSKQIKIVYDKDFTISNGTLEINTTNLITTDSSISCSFNNLTISYIISHNSTKSTPLVAINGYSSIFLGCASAEIFNYTTQVTIPSALYVIYSWTFNNLSQMASKESFTSFIETQTSSYILLNTTKYFDPYSGNFNLTVSVKNIFGESSSYTQSINIVTSKGLVIDIDGGNTYDVYPDSTWQFKAVITDSCNGKIENAQYTWALISGDNNPADYLKSLEKNQKLVIPKGTLKAGFTYNFTVTVKISNVSGSKFLIINSLSKSLVAIIDAPGQTSTLIPLTVSGERSYDPDASSLNMNYAWQCKIDGKNCQDPLKTAIEETTINKVIISADSLFDGTLTITLIVTIELRSTKVSADIIINSNTKVIAEIILPSTKAALSKDYKIMANIQLIENTNEKGMFTWASDDGVYLKDTSNPFLMITAGSFKEGGKSYTFSLTINDSPPYSLKITIKTNMPPVCDSSDSDEKEGTAIITPFVFSATCIDEDEDYPLTTSISYKISGVENFMSGGSNTKDKKTRFPYGKFSVYFSVCDTFDDCYNLEYTVVANKLGRRMADTDLEEIYNSIINEDIDQMPATIIAFTNTYTLDFEFLNTLFTDIIEYEQSQQDKTLLLLNMILSTEISLVNDFQRPSYNESFIINIYNYTYELIGNYSEYTEFQITTINYISTISDILAKFDNRNTELIKYSKNLLSYAIQIYFADKLPNFSYTQSTSSYFTSTTRYSLTLLETVSIPESDPFVVFTKVNPLIEQNDSIDYMFDVTTAYYSNSSQYSDIVEVFMVTAGKVENYNYLVDYSPSEMTSFIEPINITISTNSEVNTSYSCGFIDNDIINITTCKVVEADNGTAIISVTHLSMYVISDPLVSVEVTETNNYAPFIILVVVFFIEIMILPFVMLADNIYVQKKERGRLNDQTFAKTVEISQISLGSPTERYLGSPSMTPPEIEDFTESEGNNSGNNEFTIEFTLKPFPKNNDKKSTASLPKFQQILEGHLLFGLFYYRPTFTRSLRVMTIFTTVILQLLLEGLFIYSAYNYETGSIDSTQGIINRYKEEYFGYTIISIVVAFPVEIFLMTTFSNNHDNDKYKILYYLALILCLIITIGVFIGVFILSFKFYFPWGGFWAVCFLWSVLIEVFFLQFMYMILRFLLFRDKNLEDSKNR